MNRKYCRTAQILQSKATNDGMLRIHVFRISTAGPSVWVGGLKQQKLLNRHIDARKAKQLPTGT